MTRKKKREAAGQVTIRVKDTWGGQKVTFLADKTGLIEFECDKPVHFSHNLDISGLTARFTNRNTIEEILSDYFWQEVNYWLDFPLDDEEFDRDDDLEGYELEFVKGSRGEFDRLITMFALTEPEIENATED